MLPCGLGRGAGAKKRRAQKMLADGASLQSVALTCDVHMRTVSNYKRALSDAPSRQFELPFGD
jgi:transposase